MAETPRRVLVVEGGGMRGSYAAGVLTRLFLDEDPDYDAVWATSSGAASTAYALAGQPEGLGIWRDHLHGRRLVKPLRMLRGQSALDLDYLIDEVFGRRVPLDTAALRDGGVPLWVAATDVTDGAVRYFDAARRDPFPILRAAMSLPGAVVEPTRIDDADYVDGGVVDQVPIQRALDAGAEDVTVVLTRPAEYEPHSTGPFGTWLATRRFPGIRDALVGRHERYAAQLASIRRPPPGVRVRSFQPTEELRVRRWTTRRRRLVAAIEQGLADAGAAVAGVASAPRPHRF